MKDKCSLCGTDKFVRYSAILGNDDLYASLFKRRLLFCDECYPKWEKVRNEYYKSLRELVQVAENEHDILIAELIAKMRKMKG